MAGSVPWSVNAVDPETWADARDAARRSGQSVGEWLEAAIRDAANDRRPVRPTRAETGPLEQRLEEIAERLDQFSTQIARQPRDGGSGRSRTDSALLASIEALNARVDSISRDMRAGERDAPAEMRAAIQKFESRIEDLLSRGRMAEAQVPPDLERKLEAISRSIENMSRRVAQETAHHEADAAHSSVDDLDDAIADIMMRQSLLDGTPPPRPRPRRAAPPSSPSTLDLSALERQLKAVAEEMQSMRPAAAPDLSGFEQQLKRMTAEMQALREASLQDNSTQILRSDLQELSAKLGELAPRRSLEAIERTIESMATRLDRAGGSRSDESLREVADSLHEIRSALADVRPAESFSSVERDLQALSQKLDTLGGREIDDTALVRLQRQTEEIRDLISGALPSEVLKALVDQIEILVAKFEERNSGPDDALTDILTAFDRRLEALSERIETAHRAQPDTGALDEIRRRLDEMHRHAAHGDGEPEGRVEEALQALAEKIEATEARLGNLGAIERGLGDLFAQLEEARASAHDAAERAAKSAVRQMVTAQPATPGPAPAPEQSVRRELAELETRYRSGMELRAAAPEATPRAEAPPAVRAVEPIDIETEAPEPDEPIEPGSGVPRMRLQSAVLRVAQSEAALGGAGSTSTEKSDRTPDFIAAARRAAQAASAEPAPVPEGEPAAGGIRSVITGLIGRNRRKLLIAAAASLLVFAAVRFFDGQLPNPFGSGNPPPAPVSTTPPPAIPAKPTSAIESKPVAETEKPAESAAERVVESRPAEAKPAIAASDDPFTAKLPSGVIGEQSVHFSSPAPEITGSTRTAKPASSIRTAAAPPGKEAAPEPAAPNATAEAAKAIPAALGTEALRAAAAGGDPAAAYEIGTRYLEGRGIRADAKEALVWLERAFAKGSIPAAYRLGNIHEKGTAGTRNSAEAQRYYTIAAEAGNTKAMHNLAVMYAEGANGQPDMNAALRWFRMAADRGVRDSQYNLGVVYARGLGTDANLAESFRWFSLAAAQGDTDAGSKRDDIGKRLDAQTLVAARLAAQTWTPASIVTSANEVTLKPEWERAEAPARRRSVKK